MLFTEKWMFHMIQSFGFIRTGRNIAIHWRIGNLKNTHDGAPWRVPWQPYIEAPMFGYRSVFVNTLKFCCMVHPYIGSIVHTSERYPYMGSIVHTSERYPYIGALMFEYAFQRMATFI